MHSISTIPIVFTNNLTNSRSSNYIPSLGNIFKKINPACLALLFVEKVAASSLMHTPYGVANKLADLCPINELPVAQIVQKSLPKQTYEKRQQELQQDFDADVSASNVIKDLVQWTGNYTITDSINAFPYMKCGYEAPAIPDPTIYEHYIDPTVVIHNLSPESKIFHQESFELKIWSQCLKNNRKEINNLIYALSAYSNALEQHRQMDIRNLQDCEIKLQKAVSSLDLTKDIKIVLQNHLENLKTALNCFNDTPRRIKVFLNKFAYLIGTILICVEIIHALRKLKSWRLQNFAKLPFAYKNTSLMQLKESFEIADPVSQKIGQALEKSSLPEANEDLNSLEKKYFEPALLTIMYQAVALAKLDSQGKIIVHHEKPQYEIFDLARLILNNENTLPKHFIDYYRKTHTYNDLELLPSRSLPQLLKDLYPGLEFNDALKEIMPEISQEQIEAVRQLCGMEK